jgi:malate dehydrogenase (oxaloacetate-decarboxylating)(NADP+)
VNQTALDSGRLYPRLSETRRVSADIAQAVAEVAYQEGLAGAPRPEDLAAAVANQMYDAAYPSYA